jgi:hypothetical protein
MYETPCGPIRHYRRCWQWGQIDGFGLGIRGAKDLADNAIDGVPESEYIIYREVYALYRTTEALNDAKKRMDSVELLRRLNKMLDVFANQQKEKGVHGFVVREVRSGAEVVEVVWKDCKWSGRWDDG